MVIIKKKIIFIRTFYIIRQLFRLNKNIKNKNKITLHTCFLIVYPYITVRKHKNKKIKAASLKKKTLIGKGLPTFM